MRHSQSTGPISRSLPTLVVVRLCLSPALLQSRLPKEILRAQGRRLEVCVGLYDAADGTETNWVAVEELVLSYHNPETTLFAIYPYSSNSH